MPTPKQTRARSRAKQVRSGPAGNKRMGYNPAAKPGPIPKAPSRGASSAPKPKQKFEGAFQSADY